MGKDRKSSGAIVVVVLVFVALIVLALTAARASGASGTPAATHGGSVPVSWDGPTTCYPKKMIRDALHFVRKLRGFGPASPTDRTEMAAEAARLTRKYGIDITTRQLVSIRNMEVSLAAQRSGVRAQRLGEEIAAAAKRGDSVLTIAARHKLPPMSVLRQVLIEAGYSASEVRAMIASPSRLPGNLEREITEVFEADLGSRLNSERVRARAQVYEDAVGAHLRKLGVDFTTEDELRQRASRAPLLTPDFLIEGDPVKIDGEPIRWIDAKGYVATDSNLVMKSLKKQAAKYTKAFGKGAFVFGGGVMCDSKTARLGALMLDGSHIVA